MGTQLEQLAELTPKQLKRTLGRPTKYHSGLLPIAINYLRTYKDNNELIPTRAGLAKALDLDRETVSRWAEDDDKPEFSRIVRAVDRQQEIELVSGGLGGEYNSKVTSMMLSKHGYSEGSQGGSGVSITVNVNRDVQEVAIEGEVVDTNNQ